MRLYNSWLQFVLPDQYDTVQTMSKIFATDQHDTVQFMAAICITRSPRDCTIYGCNLCYWNNMTLYKLCLKSLLQDQHDTVQFMDAISVTRST